MGRTKETVRVEQRERRTLQYMRAMGCLTSVRYPLPERDSYTARSSMKGVSVPSALHASDINVILHCSRHVSLPPSVLPSSSRTTKVEMEHCVPPDDRIPQKGGGRANREAATVAGLD